MPSDSLQHKLDRVRRPRVQITYDVETNGALQKVELPFVVGVMADLSGQPKDPLKAVKDRKFVSIDRDNFDDVLARSAPRLAFRVDNKLTNDNTQLAVELNFKNMDDFSPAKIAEQVGPPPIPPDVCEPVVPLLLGFARRGRLAPPGELPQRERAGPGGVVEGHDLTDVARFHAEHEVGRRDTSTVDDAAAVALEVESDPLRPRSCPLARRAIVVEQPGRCNLEPCLGAIGARHE